MTLAGCGSEKYNVTGPEPITGTVPPRGPAEFIIQVVKQTEALYTVRLGGIPKLGLVRQPRRDDDSLHMAVLHSVYCNNQDRAIVVGMNNGRPQFNADITVFIDVPACEKNVVFELELVTFYGERIYHRLNDPQPRYEQLVGIRLPMTIDNHGPEGRGRLRARLE